MRTFEPKHTRRLLALPNPLLRLGIIALAFAINLHLPSAVAQGAAFTLLTTFTNPAPANVVRFGGAIAAVGTDCVLIGSGGDPYASYPGAAHLFSTNGTLLTAFTNPTPATVISFGCSVAAVGTERVLIGASGGTDGGSPYAGAAYLFSTNGDLLATLQKPTPAAGDAFGNSVAAVGTDRVLIGAPLDNTGAARAGAAYLFSTNGVLLTTFTNPAPIWSQEFGSPVAAVGPDRVIIGAVGYSKDAEAAGAAYLFSTEGTLLATFTNPTPADYDLFGGAVAAVGVDRVLISAPFDDTVAPDAGAAYLFTTNGALIATFTNPRRAAGESFGFSVAAVGPDRVLIGADTSSTGASEAGAVYLFNTNGLPLAVCTNPTPAAGDNFGWSMAALGPDRVLVGTPGDNTGAPAAGAAYLFSVATIQSPAVTIVNPTRANGACFGSAVAGVGTDRLLIAAGGENDSAGAVYMFNTGGSLLMTFTNPAPADGDTFGSSIAAVGTERVLIGACIDDSLGVRWAGAAYLFSTNGTLLTTFTNPTPAAYDFFGYSVAAVGTDQVLIGANYDDADATNAGAAYLFSTSGALLTAFTNPAPKTGANFGLSVAAVGPDRVLIGAPYNNGAAYLFSTGGALLMTFTNPAPGAVNDFGVSVAAVGTDRALIGADSENAGAAHAGAAYLFSTNGALLATFTNPTPAASDCFGQFLAAVGTDRVLIGAPLDNTGAARAGAAYLFSTNGALLASFTNPTPEDYDNFGSAVAAVGTDRVLIGACRDNTVAPLAGAAYLFDVSEPALAIRLTTTNTVALAWPSFWTGWTLQENTNGLVSASWSEFPATIQDDGTTKTVLINQPTGTKFYRLTK